MSKRNTKAQVEAKSQLIDQVAAADGISNEAAAAIVEAAEVMTQAVEVAEPTTAEVTGNALITTAEVPAKGQAKKGRAKKELDANDPFMKQTITLKRLENPKRAGSKAFARFALYRDGMTVLDFVKAGGTRGDINWDVAHSHIELTPSK